MAKARDGLSPDLGFPCVCQKQQMNPKQMLEWFRRTDQGVLFGTRSFWAGVDLPGDVLSLVVLDKVPFIPHRDPVFQRKEQLVSARGGVPSWPMRTGKGGWAWDETASIRDSVIKIIEGCAQLSFA